MTVVWPGRWPNAPSGDCQITKTDLLSLNSYGPPEKLQVVKVSCQVILKRSLRANSPVQAFATNYFFWLVNSYKVILAASPAGALWHHIPSISQERTQGRHDSAPGTLSRVIPATWKSSFQCLDPCSAKVRPEEHRDSLGRMWDLLMKG